MSIPQIWYKGRNTQFIVQNTPFWSTKVNAAPFLLSKSVKNALEWRRLWLCYKDVMNPDS
jgi:hypothetical protein